MRWMMFVLLIVMVSGMSFAQTETPIPTETALPTATPTDEPYSYATIVPEATGEPGQMTRFDYVVTAADVHIANLLTMQVLSMWAMFLFAVFVFSRRK